MTRGRIRFVLAAVAASMAVAAYFVISPSDSRPYEVSLFRQPTSFCEEVDIESFTTKVAEVDRTTPATLRRKFIVMQAGLIRQIARLDDTPKASAAELDELAREIESSGSSGDLTRARLLALDADRDARVACG